ncbi:MAG: hypothetical protein J6386_12865 [Candidatus Synoicihabitans palmerolidicus]|nr:hypothetical protein [Candidatus Synoicihabitans palmerolidicus]
MTSSLRLFTAVTVCAVVSITHAHPHAEAATSENEIGLQLYSVRKSFAQDAYAAMDMVAGYGISQVEMAGTAGMTPVQFRRELEARG